MFRPVSVHEHTLIEHGCCPRCRRRNIMLDFEERKIKLDTCRDCMAAWQTLENGQIELEVVG